MGAFHFLIELLHIVVMAHGNLSGGIDETSDAQSAMDGQLCFSPIALTSIERMAFMLIQLYDGSLSCLLRVAVYFQNYFCEYARDRELPNGVTYLR